MCKSPKPLLVPFTLHHSLCPHTLGLLWQRQHQRRCVVRHPAHMSTEGCQNQKHLPKCSEVSLEPTGFCAHGVCHGCITAAGGPLPLASGARQRVQDSQRAKALLVSQQHPLRGQQSLELKDGPRSLEGPGDGLGATPTRR